MDPEFNKFLGYVRSSIQFFTHLFINPPKESLDYMSLTLDRELPFCQQLMILQLVHRR